MSGRSEGKKSERELVIEEFQQRVTALRAAEHDSQVSVAWHLNMAYSLFRQRFASTQDFRNISYFARLKYLRSLTKMEIDYGKKDPLGGLAWGLFKAWVGAIAFGDVELEQLTSNALSEISHLAP